MLTSVFGYIKYGFGRVVNKCWLKILSLIGPNKAAVYYGWKFSRMCKNYDSSRKTVFTYTRPQFKRDIDELKRQTDFNFIVCDIEDLFNITDAFIPHTYGGQMNFNSDTSKECLVYKKIIVDFFHVVLRIISKKIKVHFVFCANFDCSYDYGLAEASRKLGIKSFVFYYEHPTIPYSMTWWNSQISYYKPKLYADKFFLWSDLVKDCILKNEVCRPDQLIITGPPRFDRWKYLEKNNPENIVTLMAYPGLEYFALCNFIDVITTLANLSKKWTDHKFYVKCKNSSQTFLTNDYLDGIQGHKLIVSHDVDLPCLQSRSKVVIGFNSLSAIESLKSNALLITPCWGDAHLVPFLMQIDPADDLANKIIQFPKSKAEFINSLEDALKKDASSIHRKSEETRKLRDEFLSRYIYLPKDQTSCEIISKYMKSELDEKI